MKILFKYMTPNGVAYFYNNVINDSLSAVIGAAFISFNEKRKYRKQ